MAAVEKTNRRELTEKEKERTNKFMDMVNNPESYSGTETLFRLIESAWKVGGPRPEKDEEDIQELAGSMLWNLEEARAGVDLICGMVGNHEPIDNVRQILVTYEAINDIANRLDQNILCAMQEILIEYQDKELMEEYGRHLQEKCRFNPANSDDMPKEVREAQEGGEHGNE